MFFKRRNKPGKFLILSCGKSGSGWLASSLSLHEDMCVSCGVDHPITSYRFEHNIERVLLRFEEIEKAKDPYSFFKYGITKPKMTKAWEERCLKKLRENPAALFVAPASIIQQYFLHTLKGDKIRERQMGLNCLYFLFDELETFEPGCRFYGNAHALTCRILESEEVKVFVKKHAIVCVDLIRHPISRFNTEKNLMPGFYENNIKQREMVDASLKEAKALDLFRLFKLDPEDKEHKALIFKYFFTDIHKRWINDILAGDIPRYKMEELMSQPETLKQLVGVLTRNKVELNSHFLDKVYCEKNLDSGRFSSKKRNASPAEIWESWTEIEKKLFLTKADELKLISFYEQYGYDFSFIK